MMAWLRNGKMYSRFARRKHRLCCLLEQNQWQPSLSKRNATWQLIDEGEQPCPARSGDPYRNRKLYFTRGRNIECAKLEMGNDYPGYKNHVYRMIHFCFALHVCKSEEREKIIIAGCFHDLGIWPDNSIDYLLPSIALAKECLTQNGLDHWFAEIELMIDMQQKLAPYRDEHYPLVKVFRKGDLVDFSLGIVKCGVPTSFIKCVKGRFPHAGFHKRLVQLELGWVSKHPSNPLPILKW